MVEEWIERGGGEGGKLGIHVKQRRRDSLGQSDGRGRERKREREYIGFGRE